MEVEKPRYVRWHGDGLIFEAEDLARLAIMRRGSEVGAYDVVVNPVNVIAEPTAPVIEVEGIYGIYELMSGPYIALVMESEALFPELYGESDVDAGTLRKVIKIGLAPLYLEGRRRLNSKEQADEALVIKLLTNTLQSLPLVFSRQVPQVATHSVAAAKKAKNLHTLKELAASRKVQRGFDSDDDDDDDDDNDSESVPDEDDEDEGSTRFYLFDTWDEKFMWNRICLDKILQCIANANGQDSALGWCLRCSVGQIAKIQNKIIVISRLARQNIGSLLHEPKLPLDFIETEIIHLATHESFCCARAVLYSQVDLLEGVIKNLVIDYGGHFVTLVDLCKDGLDPDWKYACSQLASLTRGAKLRHLVLDASAISTTQETGILVNALSPAHRDHIHHHHEEDYNDDDDRQDDTRLHLHQTKKNHQRLRGGLVLFLGQDSEIDLAIIACAKEALTLTGISHNQLQRDWPGVHKLRKVLGNTTNGFLNRLKSAVYHGPLADGLDLALATRSPGLESLSTGKQVKKNMPSTTANTKKPRLVRNDSTTTLARTTATTHRFIPAQIPVYPLDLIDIAAFKLCLLLFLTFTVVSYYTTPQASFKARLSCSLLILGQTLGLLFANSILDNSLFTDLASCRRFAFSSPSSLQ